MNIWNLMTLPIVNWPHKLVQFSHETVGEARCMCSRQDLASLEGMLMELLKEKTM